jgi:hypothetical protein
MRLARLLCFMKIHQPGMRQRRDGKMQHYCKRCGRFM